MYLDATMSDLDMLNRILTEWTILVGSLFELNLLPTDARRVWIGRRDRSWFVYIRNLNRTGGTSLPSQGVVLSELRRRYFVNPGLVVLAIATFLEEPGA